MLKTYKNEHMCILYFLYATEIYYISYCEYFIMFLKYQFRIIYDSNLLYLSLGYKAFNFQLLNERVLTMYMLDVFKRKMKGYMLNECTHILAPFAYSVMRDYI